MHAPSVLLPPTFAMAKSITKSVVRSSHCIAGNQSGPKDLLEWTYGTLRHSDPLRPWMRTHVIAQARKVAIPSVSGVQEPGGVAASFGSRLRRSWRSEARRANGSAGKPGRPVY